MFQPGELRKIIEAASTQLRAMIYLGLNCGFGNNDCALLPLSALDLDGGWIEFARPKTGINRRCPLWPETLAALHSVLDDRKEPKNSDLSDRVFLTKYGHAWVPKSVKDSPISNEFVSQMSE
jgi:integrase